jgi:hypothetical protein
MNAKATDSTGNSAWSASRTYHVVSATNTNNNNNNTNTGNTATQSWIWSLPDKSTLNTDESAVWSVGAWDAEGLQRIEVWVNGQVKNVCQFGNAYGNRDCSYAIRANDYAAGTNVFVNANILDSQGSQTWSNSRNYLIQTSTPPANQNFPVDLPGWIQVTSNADSGFTNNQLITFSVTADDQDGIDRIDIMVSGALVKSCYNQKTCSYTGGPYNDHGTLAYGAKVIDKKGFALWTGYKVINKK